MQELIEFLEKRGLKEKAGSLKDGKLDLNYKDIGIEGARLIAKVLENDNSITELRLNGQYGKSNIGAEEIKLIVEALKDSNSITELNLGYNNIDDKGAAYIAELITSNNCINRIYIEENKITTEGAKLILQALKSNSFSSVTLLEFGPSSINEKIIDDISEYLSENKVELNKEAEKLYKDGYSLYKELMLRTKH